MKKKMEVIKEKDSYKVETWDEAENKYSYIPDEDVIVDNETGEKMWDVYGEYIEYNQHGEVTSYMNSADLRPVDWDGLDYYTPQGRQDLTKIERFWGNDMTDDPSARGWHIVRDNELDKVDVLEIRLKLFKELFDLEIEENNADTEFNYMCGLIENEVEYKNDRFCYIEGEKKKRIQKHHEVEKKRKEIINKYINIFYTVEPDIVYLLKLYKNNDITERNLFDCLHPAGKYYECYEVKERKKEAE